MIGRLTSCHHSPGTCKSLLLLVVLAALLVVKIFILMRTRRVMFIKMMAMINYLQHHGLFSTGCKTLYWLFFIKSERDLINWALHGIANYCTILVVFFALFCVTFTFLQIVVPDYYFSNFLFRVNYFLLYH